MQKTSWKKVMDGTYERDLGSAPPEYAFERIAAHGDVIRGWIEGGEVEMLVQCGDPKWVCSDPDRIEFTLPNQYRIKPK